MAEHVYIRQGDLPEGGRSRNFDHGGLEAGVSCYDGWLHEDGSYEVRPGNVDLAVHFAVFRTQGRPAYVLEGEEVGRGTEGEPLLLVRSAKKLPASPYPGMSKFWEAAARVLLRDEGDGVSDAEIVLEMSRGPLWAFRRGLG